MEKNTLNDIKDIIRSFVKNQEVKVHDKDLAKKFIANVDRLTDSIDELSEGIEYVSGQLAELTDKVDELLE